MRSLPLNIVKLNVSESVEGSLLEVNIMEVSIHVQTGRSEVIRPRHVGNQTFYGEK